MEALQSSDEGQVWVMSHFDSPPLCPLRTNVPWLPGFPRTQQTEVSLGASGRPACFCQSAGCFAFSLAKCGDVFPLCLNSPLAICQRKKRKKASSIYTSEYASHCRNRRQFRLSLTFPCFLLPQDRTTELFLVIFKVVLWHKTDQCCPLDVTDAAAGTRT